MRQFILTLALVFSITSLFAQETTKEEIPKANGKDTSRYKVGNVNIYVFKDPIEEVDTVDASPSEEEAEKNEKHWHDANWEGIDFGVNVLTNGDFGTSFNNNKYWENDPANSFNYNLNLFNRKYSIYRNYIGIVTGVGFNFTQYAFKNNYVIKSNLDSVYAQMDTVFNFSKNKLKATYIQIPLLLEFSSNDNNKYISAGIVGGLRIESKIKREGEFNGKNFHEKSKGTYDLNSFKLDATLRMGVGNVGVYASYALIPLFEVGKTVPVHPFSIGAIWHWD
jgi:hypothetical protein